MARIIPSNPEIAKRAASRKFYQLIIRWHFFCGLLFIPLTIVISISGCIYLFEDEYEEFMYKELLFVPPGDEVLPASTLLAIAKTAVPQMRAGQVKINGDKTRSTEIIFRSKRHKTQPDQIRSVWNGQVMALRKCRW